MKYKIIYADPAWAYKTWSKKGKGRSPKYDVMTLEQMKNLNVQAIANKDSLLFMWSTYPHLPQALELMNAWGFTYATVGFTWVKTIKNEEKVIKKHFERQPYKLIHWTGKGGLYHMGMGYYTRANPEIVLIGKRGKGVPRLEKNTPNLVIERIGNHSEKPDRVAELIDNTYGFYLPKVELFARKQRTYWECVGNELGVKIEDWIEREK